MSNTIKLTILFGIVLFIGCGQMNNGQPTTEAEIPPAFNSDQKAVQQVILNLFKGMKLGDSTLVHKSFRDDVKLFTIFSRNDSTQFRNDGGLQKFLEAVGSPHETDWNEWTWGYKINIDGPLAQAWCDYAFYIGDKFSHCGVDAFELVKTDGEWKIFALADTRRKKNCSIPENVEIFKP